MSSKILHRIKELERKFCSGSYIVRLLDGKTVRVSVRDCLNYISAPDSSLRDVFRNTEQNTGLVGLARAIAMGPVPRKE